MKESEIISKLVKRALSPALQNQPLSDDDTFYLVYPRGNWKIELFSFSEYESEAREEGTFKEFQKQKKAFLHFIKSNMISQLQEDFEANYHENNEIY